MLLVYPQLSREYSLTPPVFLQGILLVLTSDYGFGVFSWGRIDVKARNVATSYTAYTSGITTSTRVVRSNFLKSKNYTANSNK